MLEVLMTKNENNSHAFLRKMVENIKRTKDAQCPEDTKANEVRAATNAKGPTEIGTESLFCSLSSCCGVTFSEAVYRV